MKDAIVKVAAYDIWEKKMSDEEISLERISKKSTEDSVKTFLNDNKERVHEFKNTVFESKDREQVVKKLDADTNKHLDIAIVIYDAKYNVGFKENFLANERNGLITEEENQRLINKFNLDLNHVSRFKATDKGAQKIYKKFQKRRKKPKRMIIKKCSYFLRFKSWLRKNRNMNLLI